MIRQGRANGMFYQVFVSNNYGVSAVLAEACGLLSSILVKVK